MQRARLVKNLVSSGCAHASCHRTPSKTYSILTRPQTQSLLYKHGQLTSLQRRHFLLRMVLRNVVKIRYIVLGAAGTAGVSAKMTYDQWKEKWVDLESKIPEINWMKDYYPDNFIDKIGDRFNRHSENLGDVLEATKKLLFGVAGDINEVSNGIGETVHESIPLLEASPLVIEEEEPVAKFEEPVVLEEKSVNTDEEYDAEIIAWYKGEIEKLQEHLAQTQAELAEKDVEPFKARIAELQELLARSQEELVVMQQSYQKEIDKVEKENQNLREQILLGRKQTVSGSRKVKQTIIDMYSDMLDILAEYDSNYEIEDHLPRVVVIGDQSAGKTSVLEMIAKARIFPRGSGQMMTRCPIMVTLTEGPNHVACFKEDEQEQEFDLSRESELKLLREQVQLRMKKKLKGRQTISTEPMSMVVKGPGLPRMVLVDLPGIISTETVEMAQHTKDSILSVSKHYMQNPNAIILCVQDGSIDAERSIVTELASQMDPVGKRTIFVMTKMDQAEANQSDPTRIQKILSGKLFPMKAKGYFAVVTGSGNNNDSIDSIRRKEDEYFRKSMLIKTGILKTNQTTTANLSHAVSQCFWQMVRESVEEQFDAFKAKKFNLETEWKNNYPTVRELDRNELFDKGRGEILDEVLSVSQILPKEWEEKLAKNLWDQVGEYAFEEIYLPAAQKGNAIDFKTKIDILLKEWTDASLPDYAIQVGYLTLIAAFAQAMEDGVEIGGKKDAHSILFEDLKAKVKKDCEENHGWLLKARDSLRVIQLTALEDSNVPTKEQWDDAIRFMEDTIATATTTTEEVLSDLIGPGWKERWVYWTSRTREQHTQNEIKKELDRLLNISQEGQPAHGPELAEDEVTTVKRNLQTNNFEASPAEIIRVWQPLYRSYFLERSLQGLQECRKAYYHRDLSKNELECNDLILFWRFQKMLQSTSNSLRQQIVNTEARRLENVVKEILDDIDDDGDYKKELLQGRQVDLAEELKRVRHIQEHLEKFIEALRKEKTV